MLEKIRKYAGYSIAVSLILTSFFMYGCGSDSSDPVSSRIYSENARVINGSIECEDSPSFPQGAENTGLYSCHVWAENDSGNKVKPDEKGNFQLVSNYNGNTRVIAQIDGPNGAYIGISKPISVSDPSKGSFIPPIEVKKCVNPCLFKLTDSNGSPLSNSQVRPTVLGIPAEYDPQTGLWHGPSLPQGTEVFLKIQGGGVKEMNIPFKSTSKSSVFQFPTVKSQEPGLPSFVTSLVSSNGEEIDTDFVHSGSHDLDLAASFSANSEIVSCIWDDGGLGTFIRKDENPAMGRSTALWRPSSANEVGTITFSICDREGHSSKIELGINSSLQTSGQGVDPSFTASVSFGTLNFPDPDGCVYNPTSLQSENPGELFKVKINISGIVDPSYLFGGKVKGAVSFEGCVVAPNGDETPEGILTDRVYSLIKPSLAGSYKIKVILKDKNGRTSSDEYITTVNGSSASEALKCRPLKPYYNKTDSITFNACANEFQGNASKFSWFIDDVKVLEETKNTNSGEFTWNEFTSAYPLDENLTDGKYTIKCIITSVNGASSEVETQILVTDPILISFLKDTSEPPRYNPTYRDSADPGFFDLKAFVANRNKEDITAAWEFSHNGNAFQTAEYSNKSFVNSGPGCTLSLTLNNFVKPGSYIFRLSVTDKYGITESKTMEEMYVDGEPQIKDLRIVQNGRLMSERYDIVNMCCNSESYYKKLPEFVYFVFSDQDFDVNAIIQDEDVNDPLKVDWEIYAYKFAFDYILDNPLNLILSDSVILDSKNTQKTCFFNFPKTKNRSTSYFGGFFDCYIIKITVRDTVFNNPSHVKFYRIAVVSGITYPHEKDKWKPDNWY